MSDFLPTNSFGVLNRWIWSTFRARFNGFQSSAAMCQRLVTNSKRIPKFQTNSNRVPLGMRFVKETNRFPQIQNKIRPEKGELGNGKRKLDSAETRNRMWTLIFDSETAATFGGARTCVQNLLVLAWHPATCCCRVFRAQGGERPSLHGKSEESSKKLSRFQLVQLKGGNSDVRAPWRPGPTAPLVHAAGRATARGIMGAVVALPAR